MSNTVWLLHTYEHGPLELLEIVRSEAEAESRVAELTAGKTFRDGNGPGYDEERIVWNLKHYLGQTIRAKTVDGLFDGPQKSVWAVVSDYGDGHVELSTLFASEMAARAIAEDNDEDYVVEVPIRRQAK